MSRRLSGFLLVLAGVVALGNAPLATFASARAYASSKSDSEPNGLEPLFEFSEPDVVYATYGKVWVPVLLLALPVLRTLAPEKVWGRLLLTGLALLIVGNVGDYWLGKSVLGEVLWGAAFVLTGLGSLAYMVAAFVIGVDAWRHAALPRLGAAALAIAPLGLPANALLPNWPAAFFFVAAIGWITTGSLLLRHRHSKSSELDLGT